MRKMERQDLQNVQKETQHTIKYLPKKEKPARKENRKKRKKQTKGWCTRKVMKKEGKNLVKKILSYGFFSVTNKKPTKNK